MVSLFAREIRLSASTVNDLINCCDCKLLIGDKNAVIGECYVNSKLKINDGCFFGIKGENVDGSLFYKEAFDNGANIQLDMHFEKDESEKIIREH